MLFMSVSFCIFLLTWRASVANIVMFTGFVPAVIFKNRTKIQIQLVGFPDQLNLDF